MPVHIGPLQVISFKMHLNRFPYRLIKGTRNNHVSRVPIPRRRVRHAAIKRVKRVLRVPFRSRTFSNVNLSKFNRTFLTSNDWARHTSTYRHTTRTRHRHSVTSGVSRRSGRTGSRNRSNKHCPASTSVPSHIRLRRFGVTNVNRVIRLLVTILPTKTDLLRLIGIRCQQARTYKGAGRRLRTNFLKTARAGNFPVK